jgi:ATP-binding cassette, subfamily G (WHITE), member 2, PDR
LFDKVIVLYEGRQIFFGKTSEAKAYFEGLGFQCPEQQTTPDFLTSMTSPSERIIHPGWKGKTPPRSPDEFARAWKESGHRKILTNEIDDFQRRFPIGGLQSEQFRIARSAQKSGLQRTGSPYTLSLAGQFTLNLWRSYRLLLSDPWMTITMLFTNFFEAIIISSIFYNMPVDSSSIDNRNLLIFFTVLINGLGSMLEILTLYDKRKIVEKHRRYALYHPSIEAVSSLVMDLPYKLANSICVNVTLYFMCNLRREPGPFFFFFLLTTVTIISMSAIFRFLGSVTKTQSQALAPAAVILLGVILYSGFAIPQTYLDDWIGWLRWINPVFYIQESLTLNEFVGRQFPCANFVPSGPGYAANALPMSARVCSVEGSVTGELFVDGAEHLRTTYGFVNAHRWRNFGIVIALTVFFLVCHLVATELITSEQSKGEVLIFPRGVLKKQGNAGRDEEMAAAGRRCVSDKEQRQDGEVRNIAKQTSVFHWKDICYKVDIKGETRTILDHVDGWVKPGTLTALMVGFAPLFLALSLSRTLADS